MSVECAIDLEAPQPVRRVAVLYNEAAGSVARGDLEALQGILTAHAVTDITSYDVDEIDTLFASAREFDRLVVLGGDGTARAVAARMPPAGPPLILLPGGTMNVLPNALFGPGAWRDVLEFALTGGEVRRLSAGAANGELFFVAAMFGAPALLARAREAVRKGRLLQAMNRVNRFFERAFSRRLRAYPERCARREVEAVGVLCAAMFGNPSGKDFEWVNLTATGYLELARAGMSALGPNWREDPAVDALQCSGGVIRGVGAIPATLDGEPMELRSPIWIRFVAEGPLVVHRPAAAARD